MREPCAHNERLLPQVLQQTARAEVAAATTLRAQLAEARRSQGAAVKQAKALVLREREKHRQVRHVTKHWPAVARL